MNALSFIKSKMLGRFGKVSLLLVAVLAIVLAAVPRAHESAKAVSCPNPPTQPQLNIYPITFLDPAEVCHDFAPIDARLTNGQYSQSQADYDNGLTANEGDEIYVLAYIHNGAANVGVPDEQTLAKDVKISFNVPTSTGSDHVVTTQFGGSNTNTVNGNFTIHTGSDQKLEVVPGSGQLFDDTGTIVKQSGFDAANGNTFTIGDLHACFEFSVFVRFKVRVVRSAPANTTLSIVKEVRNVTTNGNFTHSITANQNDTAEYRIRIRNTGNTTANNVIATDTFASGLTFVPGSLSVSVDQTGQLTGSGMSLGNLSPNQEVTIIYRATVNQASGTIVNTATARADNASQVQDSANVTVNPIVNNPVVCTPDSQTVAIGQTAFFQASGGNGSFAWSASGGNPSSGSGASFNTAYTTSGSRTVTVSSDGFTDTCSVSVNPNTPSNTSLNITKEVRNISNGGGFAHSIDAEDGDTVEYRIRVRNVGNVTAENVIVTDTFASGLDFISGSVSVSVNFSGQLTGGGMSLGNLSTGQEATITYRATVNQSSGTIDNTAAARANNASQVEDSAFVHVNEQNNRVVCTPERQTVDIDEDASFRATGGDGHFEWTASGGHPSSDTGSRFTTHYISSGTKTVRVESDGFSDTCTVRVSSDNNNNEGDLQITKLVRNITTGSGFRNSVNANDNDRVEYKITVENTGDASVTHVRLTDDMPRGLANVEDFDNDLGTIRAGDEETVTFEARVDADAVSSNSCIVNTATARGDDVDRVEDSASVCVSSVLGENINLNFSKRAWNDTRNADAQSVTANRDDFITYTLTVSNTGNAKANDFVITDDLSGVLPFVDIIDIDGATLNSNTLTFPPVTVPAGGSVQKTFRVRIKHSLQNNLTFVLRNTYGNTVTINVGSVQGVSTFVAPKTGAAGTSAAVFAGLLTSGFFVFRKRRSLLKLIWS